MSQQEKPVSVGSAAELNEAELEAVVGGAPVKAETKKGKKALALDFEWEAETCEFSKTSG